MDFFQFHLRMNDGVVQYVSFHFDLKEDLDHPLSHKQSVRPTLERVMNDQRRLQIVPRFFNHFKQSV